MSRAVPRRSSIANSSLSLTDESFRRIASIIMDDPTGGAEVVQANTSPCSVLILARINAGSNLGG